MASMSKRHQARNERALQDLVQSVPGNDRCADCQARNPGWASWSLGIFLCMRCGSLHRKLGTHVSKVKSLSMDSWSADQVENMRKVGNVASNQKYNPSNTQARIPLDVDEVDSAMERFIRQKYEQKALMAGAPARTPTVRAEPSYPREFEHRDESPPPPPPKSGRKFGINFRAASAALPGRSKNTAEPVRRSSAAASGKVISAAFGLTDEGMERKLVTLKEMGFQDEKRNSSVLKGHNGDLERAIESLVRLGEGSAPIQRTVVRDTGNNTPTQRTEFDRLQSNPAQPLARSPTEQAQPSQDFWDVAPVSAPLQPLDNAFQNMHINQSQPQSQPLFPNATGGHLQHQTLYIPQQSMTPPVPQMPQQYTNNPYAQTHNPFMAPPLQSPAASTNPFLAGQPLAASNPFLAMSTGTPQFAQPQQQLQQQQQTMQQQWPQQPYAAQQFASQQPQQNQTQMNFNPYQQAPQFQQQPMMPQATGHMNNANILALYNYPQLAPQPQSPSQEQPGSATGQSPAPRQIAPVQRSVTMPVTGSKNPFAGAATATDPIDERRHSPDAFASLSARFVR